MTSMAQTGPTPNPKRELQKRIVVSAELEEIMKRVSDLKNVAGMVVVNSEGYKARAAINEPILV